MLLFKRMFLACALSTMMFMGYAQESLNNHYKDLKENLAKIKPITEREFVKSLPKEISGFKLAEHTYNGSDEYGSDGTANYVSGDKNVYISLSDGAGAGSENAISTAQNHLDLSQIDNGPLMKVVDFKKTKAVFDSSFYEENKMVSIAYFDGKRFVVNTSANNITIDELQKFLEQFPY